MTDQQQLLAHLQSLEMSLLDPEVRRSPRALDALIADDFCEIGQSGRTYDKSAIIRHLSAPPSGSAGLRYKAPEVDGFRLRVLSPDVGLLMYESQTVRDGATVARTIRTSIWRRESTGWRMIFHQGTPALGGS